MGGEEGIAGNGQGKVEMCGKNKAVEAVGRTAGHIRPLGVRMGFTSLSKNFYSCPTHLRTSYMSLIVRSTQVS